MNLKLENVYFTLNLESSMQDLDKLCILHEIFFTAYKETFTKMQKIKLIKLSEEKQLEEMDSAGIPWDKRIHSPGKIKTKQGTWRTKNGVDKEVARQIQDEILDKSIKNTGEIEDDFEMPPSCEIPLPPKEAIESDISFGDIMKLINALIEAQIMTKSEVNKELLKYDIKDLMELMDKPELFNKIYEKLNSLISNFKEG